MPRTRALSVRVDVELLEWLDGYVAARGSTRSAVVQAALRAFRELARGGVPDLPELPAADGRSASLGRVRGAGARVSSSAGRASAVSRPAAGAPAPSATLERVVAARQHGPVALARRDVRAGRVLVDGVVCRDPERLVAPASVEVA